ncbi:NOA1, partial [Symbiodinium necroappetens]
YVRFSNYLQKWSQRLHRKLLCSRCLDLEQGQLVPVVKEVMAEGEVGFGGKVVPADVLAQQLRTISKRRCLVVYIVDVLDFNGSFIRKIRQIVGKNPVILVGTKIDLLPPKTKLELVEKWLLYILRKKKLRVVNVKLVSNETGKHINHAVNAIIEARSGMDVFVVGAANAGKSRFITRLLDRLE